MANENRTAWSLGRGMSAAALAVLASGAAYAQPCEPMWLPTFEGEPLSSVVSSMRTFDDGFGTALFVGGSFTTAGDQELNRIGRWDGTEWVAPGGGFDQGTGSNAGSLTIFDDGDGPKLYVTGNFNTIGGGVPARRVARWNGTAWQELPGDSSVTDAFNVMGTPAGTAGFDGSLYIMSNTANIPTSTDPGNRIVRWDGTSIFPVGIGMDSQPQAGVVFDDGTGEALYVGGFFTTADGVPGTNRIARWDGSQWSALDDGLNGTVRALAVFDDGTGPALYAGGDFTLAGSTVVNRIAKWDGTSWSPLGDGMNGRIWALEVYDDGSGPALFAGGGFTTAGGETAQRIAKWDGTSWTGLDSGMTARVRALEVFDSGDGLGPALYVGGDFTTAGGFDSGRIARYQGCPAPACPVDLTGDGLLDADDFFAFLDLFGAGDSAADLTDDGLLDADDFFEFLNQFAAGCP